MYFKVWDKLQCICGIHGFKFDGKDAFDMNSHQTLNCFVNDHCPYCLKYSRFKSSSMVYSVCHFWTMWPCRKEILYSFDSLSTSIYIVLITLCSIPVLLLVFWIFLFFLFLWSFIYRLTFIFGRFILNALFSSLCIITAFSGIHKESKIVCIDYSFKTLLGTAAY